MVSILLIEPDRLLADSYCLALASAGHQVGVCPSAQAGIMVADQVNPDLVVLEIQLVEHSGIEFLYEFRSYPEWQAVPVLIHSNVPLSEFEADLGLLRTELGVTGYLYKPQTTLNQLITAVEEQLTVAA